MVRLDVALVRRPHPLYNSPSGVALLFLSLTLALAAESFQGHTYWLGDPHAHTGLSRDAAYQGDGCPGCGAAADVLSGARDQGLDWVAFTDHVNGGQAADSEAWATFQAEVLAPRAARTTVAGGDPARARGPVGAGTASVGVGRGRQGWLRRGLRRFWQRGCWGGGGDRHLPAGERTGKRHLPARQAEVAVRLPRA